MKHNPLYEQVSSDMNRYMSAFNYDIWGELDQHTHINQVMPNL